MIVERSYATKFDVADEFIVSAQSPEPIVRAMVDDAGLRLRRWLRAQLLVPTETLLHRQGDKMRCSQRFTVEQRATGLPPEERLPQGWRGFFMAP